MRLVASIPDESLAMRFRAVLSREKIEHQCEAKEEGEKRLYYFWVHNEDELERALELFKNLENEPDAPMPPPPPQDAARDELKVEVRPVARRLLKAPLTRGIIFLCVILFTVNLVQKANLKKTAPAYAAVVGFTPLDEKMMYDYPDPYLALKQYFYENPEVTIEEGEKIPLEVRQELTKIDAMPMWRGLYGYFTTSNGITPSLDVPMFVKIRKGEVWRLFTPAILHSGFLHILFNMLWLWFLGKFVEHNIKLSRYLVLSIIIAIISNTCQYLMNGPNFLGYSGVISGLAGYIMIRQKVAPWEEYPIPRGIFYFLIAFIFGMAAFQLLAYFLHTMQVGTFTLGIANTAHISGLFTGMILAKIPYFEAH